MIALLSGAKRNVGDHLITKHARWLLEQHRAEQVEWFANWEPLDDKLSDLQGASALVIAGGPGLRPDMYGGVYPLFSDPSCLLDLEVPLVFLGSGWKALLGDAWDLRHVRFDAKTRELLAALGDRAVFSTRDHLSNEMQRRHGLESVMTGCPVWYEPSSLGAPPRLPKKIERIVFTEPRNVEMEPQSLRLLGALRARYCRAEIVASFHHGFDGVEHYVEAVRSMGVEARDVAADVDKIAFYDEFDVHVGYRVHAGLYFLSRRKPSIIVSEDARGRGSAEALGVPWIPAWRYHWYGVVPRRLLPYGRISRLARQAGQLFEPREDVSRDVLDLLEEQARGGRWPSFGEVGKRIDSHYDVMRGYVESF